MKQQCNEDFITRKVPLQAEHQDRGSFVTMIYNLSLNILQLLLLPGAQEHSSFEEACLEDLLAVTATFVPAAQDVVL